MTAPKDFARLVALQRVVQHAVAAPDPSDIERLKAEGYTALGVDGADSEALVATDTRCIAVYRALVRSTLIDAIRAEIPRTAARLNDRYDGLVEN